MAYKVPADTVATMLVYIDNKAFGEFTAKKNWYRIALTTECAPGTCDTYKLAATWLPINKDDEWHYKCINLDEQLDAEFGPGQHLLSAVIWHDAYGNARNRGSFRIDEFSISKYAREMKRLLDFVNPLANSVIVTRTATTDGRQSVNKRYGSTACLRGTNINEQRCWSLATDYLYTILKKPRGSAAFYRVNTDTNVHPGCSLRIGPHWWFVQYNRHPTGRAHPHHYKLCSEKPDRVQFNITFKTDNCMQQRDIFVHGTAVDGSQRHSHSHQQCWKTPRPTRVEFPRPNSVGGCTGNIEGDAGGISAHCRGYC
jgi:hypothetical protein